MFFAIIFEMFIVKMKDNRPEIIITRRIIVRLFKVSSGIICEMVAAAPVLVLFIEESAMNDRPITIVLMAPKRNKNSL